MIISTVYQVAGELTTAQTRAVKGRVYQVPRVGGLAFEVQPGHDTRMIIKHKSDEPIDRADLATALSEAGNFRLR